MRAWTRWAATAAAAHKVECLFAFFSLLLFLFLLWLKRKSVTQANCCSFFCSFFLPPKAQSSHACVKWAVGFEAQELTFISIEQLARDAFKSPAAVAAAWHANELNSCVCFVCSLLPLAGQEVIFFSSRLDQLSLSLFQSCCVRVDSNKLQVSSMAYYITTTTSRAEQQLDTYCLASASRFQQNDH